MRFGLSVVCLATMISPVALAENWSGRLLDASCAQQQKTDTSTCQVTSSTTQFSLAVGDKVYQLDSAGNQKAATAVRGRTGTDTKEVQVKVEGKEQSGTIQVDNIELQ